MSAIEVGRLERKLDTIQNDVTILRQDLGLFRSESHSEFKVMKEEILVLKTEMRAGFDRVERVLLNALDRR